MSITERQLETWSHQGSITQSAATYKSIRSVLENGQAPYASRTFEIFLQGSYANDTNVFAESDVDIVICLSSVFYHDITELSEGEQAAYNADRTRASYTFNQFKKEVGVWLQSVFGNGVKVGSKAIFIPGEGGRRDADVLVCVEHHRYTSYRSKWEKQYHKGICFWTSSGEKIVNYPKQHAANCTGKHQSTQNRFKPNVRVFKNVRNAMVDARCLEDGVAPSYFIEGLLWNVPDVSFSGSYVHTAKSALIWLNQCDASKLVCANGLHWLIRDGASECWNDKDYRTFLRSTAEFLKSG